MRSGILRGFLLAPPPLPPEFCLSSEEHSALHGSIDAARVAGCDVAACATASEEHEVVERGEGEGSDVEEEEEEEEEEEREDCKLLTWTAIAQVRRRCMRCAT